MQLYDLNSGERLHEFKLDVGTISAISGKKHHKEMFFSFCSFLTPNIIFKVDFDGRGDIKEKVKMSFSPRRIFPLKNRRLGAFVTDKY
jgi:hypothetical protein